MNRSNIFFDFTPHLHCVIHHWKRSIVILQVLLFILMDSGFSVRASSPDIKGGGTVSMFQPLDAADTLKTKLISIYNQQIKVDLFDGYAAVNAKYWLNNSSEKNIQLIVGLPVKSDDFSDIYFLRVSINNQSPFSPRDSLSKRDWQFWEINFLPGVTEVDLYYGVKTEGAFIQDGDKKFIGNCFRYDFLKDNYWSDNPRRGEIWFRMNGGYITKDILGLLPDKKFLGGNSIVHTWKENIVTDSSQEVVIWYRELDSIPFHAGRISWEMKFSNLTGWNPDEKILKTLHSFTADDFYGKQFQQEINNEQTISRWNWIAGVIIIVVVLISFVYIEMKNRKVQ